MCLVAIEEGGRMALVDHTRIRRDGMAAIAAAVMLIALAVANSAPPWAVARPTEFPAGSSMASRAAVSADSEIIASHKGKRDLGIRGLGVILDDDVFTTTDAPGASVLTLPFGTNDRGQLVGIYVDGGGRFHGFLLDNGSVTVATAPTSINNHGQIVGLFFDVKRRRGFMLSNGTFTILTAPGAAL
jgi:hypothetical protein